MNNLSELTTLAPTQPNVSATGTVVEKLARHILDEMKPGMQLPSEAALAKQYLVSRITIREALKILTGRGLVSIARGRRAEVRQPDGAVYGEFLRSLIRNDPKCLFDLLQVRRSLEIQSVVFAARHASRAGLAAVEAALKGMRDAAAEFEFSQNPDATELRFHKADVGFHEAMALAGGNRVLIYLFESMASSLQEAFVASHRGQRILGKSLQDSLEAHRRILENVSAGDEKAAAETMTELLDSAESNLLAAYGNSFLVNPPRSSAKA
jgi:GntR family transcriptional regulator, transcriptional repressor for pyruvate dehydrogenase complex